MRAGANSGKELITLGVHFAIFMIFMVMTRGRFPNAGLYGWWGLGLAIHAVVTVRSALIAASEARRLGDPGPAEQSALPMGVPARANLGRGFWGEATTLLDSLERQRREHSLHPTLDLHALREAIAELHRRTEALGTIGDAAELYRLQLALEGCNDKAKHAPDEASAEAHELEAEALQDRISGLQAALSTRERLQARQRTLLHQLQSLRTAAAHALATEAPDDFDDLKVQAERLHEEVRASREIEEELARGRRLAAGRALRRPVG